MKRPVYLTTAVMAVSLFASALPGASLSAQSLLDRSPNMGGTWVGMPGTLYFNFLHRFESTPPPARKVINYPTFLLGAGLPGNILLGAQYATNSLLVSNYPNEWQFFGKYGALMQSKGAPFDVSVTGAYSQPARSWDGELAAARNFGPLRLLGAVRGFSSFRRSDNARMAIAGGATWRLSEHMALAADVATLTNRADNEDVAWGAGVHVAIPSTPHTLSIQVSNANTTTLEGASIGLSGERHWGFEFTIPLTLSRFFGGSKPGTAAVVDAAGKNVEVTLNNQLHFAPAAIRIKAGTTVVWRNASALVHTVTADPASAPKPEDVKLPAGAEAFNSGDLKPGATFSHTFTVPGEYHYVCIPHGVAGMLGRVIVEP